MTIEWGIVGVLIVLLLIQQGFYMWQMNKMLNKVMSGNYTTYVQTQNLAKPPTEFRVPLPMDDGPDRVKELNSLFS